MSLDIVPRRMASPGGAMFGEHGKLILKSICRQRR